jgi:hypothetical protein
MDLPAIPGQARLEAEARAEGALLTNHDAGQEILHCTRFSVSYLIIARCLVEPLSEPRSWPALLHP